MFSSLLLHFDGQMFNKSLETGMQLY